MLVVLGAEMARRTTQHVSALPAAGPMDPDDLDPVQPGLTGHVGIRVVTADELLALRWRTRHRCCDSRRTVRSVWNRPGMCAAGRGRRGGADRERAARKTYRTA